MMRIFLKVLFLSVIVISAACSIKNLNDSRDRPAEKITCNISGTVSGNIFGLKIGIASLTMIGTNFTYTSSLSCSTVSFSYNLAVIAPSGTNVFIGYYIDDNGNGQLDVDTNNIIKEGFLVFTNITLAGNSSVSLNPVLKGKVIKGSISGSDASGFNLSMVGSSWGGVTGQAGGGKYEVVFYYPENSFPSSNRVVIFMDLNSNELWDAPSEPRLFYTNEIYIDGNSVTTNDLVDFDISKCVITESIDPSSDDAASFRFRVDDYTSILSPFTTNIYRFTGDTNITQFQLDIYQEINGNNAWDPEENIVLADSISISNQNSVSFNNIIKRSIINLSIIGNYTGYSNPTIRCGYLPYKISSNSMSFTNYYATNNSIFGIHGEMYAYDDLNNNGFMDSGECYISTNDLSWNEYFSATNMTIGVTN